MSASVAHLFLYGPLGAGENVLRFEAANLPAGV